MHRSIDMHLIVNAKSLFKYPINTFSSANQPATYVRYELIILMGKVTQ